MMLNVGVQPTEPAQLARVGCNDWLCRARAAEGTDRRSAQEYPGRTKRCSPARAAGVSWKQAKVCKESPLETILLLAFGFITWPG